MSKMPQSSKEIIEEKEIKEETVSETQIEEPVIEENPENKPTKPTFKDLFTKDNLKKGSLWFLNSFIWLAIILFIGDMLTKYFAQLYLVQSQPFEVIPHFLNLTLTYNKGAAWGAGGGAMWSRVLLCMVSWIAMFAIIYILIKYYKKLNNWYKASIMMILSGDVGNLIDRTFFFDRGVIDFLDITPFIPGFGIFNFADSCLVVGIIFLMILFIVDMIKDSNNKNKKAAEAEEKIKNEREK